MPVQITLVDLKHAWMVKVDGVGMVGMYRTKDAALQFITEELGQRYELEVSEVGNTEQAA
jgi:hypothetical protein